MPACISPVTPADLPLLEAFARQAFTANFGHLYAPEHLAEHPDKTCSAAPLDFSHEKAV